MLSASTTWILAAVGLALAATVSGDTVPNCDEEWCSCADYNASRAGEDGAPCTLDRTAEQVWNYINVAGGYPQGPAGIAAKMGEIESEHSAFPVVVYTYYCCWLLAMILYTAMKKSEVPVAGVAGGETTFYDGEMVIKAYKETTFGKFSFFVYHTYTAVFVILYLMLIFDTYWDCELKGPDALCFRGSKPILGGGVYPEKGGRLEYPPNINQNVFFCLWCACMSWALWNFFYGSQMPNYFRSRCTFAEATHILCKRKTKQIVMSNPNIWVQYSRKLSAYIGESQQFFEQTAPVAIAPSDGTRSFVFMCAQYTFVRGSGAFVPAEVALDNSYPALKAMKGLAAPERARRLALLGSNSIPFEIDTWGKLMGNELCSYLYMYQLTFFLVWLWFGGLIWCSPQMIVVLVCASMSIKITHANQVKIKAIGEAGLGGKSTINQGGTWTTISSENLVPGDLIKLTESNWTLPCDAVVIKGTCICDESGLTGESMPVRKSECPSTPGTYSTEKDSKHTLFAGTTLLQADREGSIAVVTQTGIRTAKGDLVAMILYPANMVFEYDEELKVVFSFLSVYAGILFGISIWLQWSISPMNWVSIFAFACFTISQILPPLLPVALVIGHTKSANRLMQKKVLCVQPKRIAISGKIHSFMFDKTGTLTKQGLDFIGVHRADGGKFTPNSGAQGPALTYDASSAKAGDALTWSLATAHAVTYLRDKTGDKLVGNQVEVQMFTGSQWTLDDRAADVVVTSARTGESLTIEKRFEFDHHTMTMSVIVRDATGNVTVFCKGAPERVGALCDPASLPADFDAVASGHAMQGCYVIGMTSRSLGNMSKADVANLTRSDVEKAGELNLIGLLLFRNELKSDTAQAIAKIKAGDVRPVMVTGDNAHCGYYIAKACNIVEPGVQIFLTDKDISNDTITWSDMAPGSTKKGLSTAEVSQLAESPSVELAITGKAMQVLTSTGLIDSLLLKTRIFARVQPEQKVQVITNYIDRGFITGMCGDGGNDCGALRTAHCGIALSEAEASVVSPFTSSTKSVQSVVDVLCEGRCALVTSFAAYRFYITYGLNWSVVKTINFVYGVRMPIAAYLTIDSICSWLCAWAITGALPLDHLLKYRPTSSLFAGNIFWSVIMPWVVNMLLMTIVLLHFPSYDEHTVMKTELTKGVGYWELGDTWESTIFTYFQVCPLIWCGMCYSLGTKFRQSVYTNIPMIGVWGTIFLIYFSVLLAVPGKFTAFFHVASNAHNGFSTESPVWMRWQMPLGCPAAEGVDSVFDGRLAKSSVYNDVTDIAGNVTTSALQQYREDIGLGSWRHELPSADTCTIIKMSVGKCGPACAEHQAQLPSPGMPFETRGVLCLVVIIGMVFMMGWEMLMNHLYLKPAQWETDEKLNPQKIVGRGDVEAASYSPSGTALAVSANPSSTQPYLISSV